jgi:hypothetical protein
MKSKILGWFIIGGWVGGFIISITLRFILGKHTHTPIDLGMVIYESFLSMCMFGIGGIFCDLNDK